MRKLLWVPLLAAIAVLLASSFGLVSAGGGGGRQTLRFRTGDVHIFGGTQRLDPRDVVVVSASLNRRGRQLGRMRQACTVTDRNETLVCDATFVIEGRGQIESQGIWDGVTAFQRTGITGGTGDFLGTGGSAAWNLENRVLRLVLVR